VTIIFEDASFLVIDKPSGLVVNRADTNKDPTVQDWVEARGPLAAGDEEFRARSGVVHRLDKDTSGLLVIAKTPEAFAHLKNQFKERGVSKKYFALVHGKVEPPVGMVNAPIERNPFNRKHFGIFPGGREATTKYKALKVFKDFSYLEVAPQTGRTHQIRVHMKYIGHPVVSDPIYGGRKNYQHDLQFCPRLFLHAAALTLSHPLTGESLTFTSPLPADLDVVLKNL
jgi:23S rRNA pseudouridine1911/1915/1917 synthase